MNTFGRKFRVSIFGESHGELIGVVLDGVPAGLELSEQAICLLAGNWHTVIVCSRHFCYYFGSGEDTETEDN